MKGTSYRTFAVLSMVAILLGGWFFWSEHRSLTTLTTDLAPYHELGERINSDFSQYPLLTFSDALR